MTPNYEQISDFLAQSIAARHPRLNTDGGFPWDKPVVDSAATRDTLEQVKHDAEIQYDVRIPSEVTEWNTFDDIRRNTAYTVNGKALHEAKYEGERVLVVPAALVEGSGGLGFRRGFGPGPDADPLVTLTALLSLASFMDRGYAEENPNFRQLIPYTVVMRDDQVLHYSRAKSGGEARLHAKRSLGVGGHINPVDFTGDRSMWEGYMKAVERELEEEIGLEPAYLRGTPILGFLRNDADEVGRVHLGIIHFVKVPDVLPLTYEKHLADPQWAPLADLMFPAERVEGTDYLFDQFETWSQLLIPTLYGRAELLTRGIATSEGDFISTDAANMALDEADAQASRLADTKTGAFKDPLALDPRSVSGLSESQVSLIHELVNMEPEAREAKLEEMDTVAAHGLRKILAGLEELLPVVRQAREVAAMPPEEREAFLGELEASDPAQHGLIKKALVQIKGNHMEGFRVSVHETTLFLLSMPESERIAALQEIRSQNPAFYNQIKDLMEVLRSTAAGDCPPEVMTLTLEMASLLLREAPALIFDPEGENALIRPKIIGLEPHPVISSRWMEIEYWDVQGRKSEHYFDGTCGPIKLHGSGRLTLLDTEGELLTLDFLKRGYPSAKGRGIGKDSHI